MDFLEVHPAAASKSAVADFDHFKELRRFGMDFL
jgi:hypothetical protein